MRLEVSRIEKSTPERALRMCGPIAQSVEQLAFNQWVAGSSPARLNFQFHKIFQNPFLITQPSFMILYQKKVKRDRLEASIIPRGGEEAE
jgi:hypothetical protein